MKRVGFGGVALPRWAIHIINSQRKGCCADSGQMTDLMKSLFDAMLPELILIGTAMVLFLLGISRRAMARRTAPVLALLALAAVVAVQLMRPETSQTLADSWNTFRV